MIVQKEMSTRAWVELVSLGLVWGGVFLAVAVLLREIPVFTLVAVRVTVAAALLWIYVLVRRRPIPRGWKVWGALLVMGCLNTAIPFTLLTFGQTQIESGLTSIFNAFTAVSGTVVAAIFLSDERMTRRKLIGAVFGVTGVAITVGLEALRSFDIRSLAQLACIGATISYAFAGVWARTQLKGIKADVATAGMLLGASVVMIPLALAFEGIPHLSISGKAWIAMLYYIPIATAFAYILYFRIVEMAGSANTLLVTLIVSPVAVILGALVLSEVLPLRAFLGFAFITIGLIIIDGRAVKRLKRVFSD